MPAYHHSGFTGRMPFLLPNQQRQSTEGTSTEYRKKTECQMVFKMLSANACLICLQCFDLPSVL